LMLKSARPLISTMQKLIRLGDGVDVQAVLRQAGDVLEAGGVVALPTDTLYGVTCRLDCSEKLYALKKRSRMKPLGLFVSDYTEMCKWAHVDGVPRAVIEALLPGPVTVVLRRSEALPVDFNPDTDRVGIRIPAHPLVQALCSRLAAPLAQTSANLSGVESPLNVDEFADLWPLVDLVLDAGPIRGSTEDGLARAGSTVVDLTEPGRYRLVRDGCARIDTERKLIAAGLTPIDDAKL